MRVAHVSTQKSWGGGEKQVCYLLRELQAKGVEQTLFCTAGSALAQKCRREPWKTVELVPPALYPIKLRHFLREVPFDLIHTHDSKGLTFVLLSMLGTKRTPIINTCRMIKKPGLFSARKFAHPAIRKHICISRAVLESMNPLVTDPEKLVLIPSGIDTKTVSEPPFEIRKKFGIPEDAFLIVSVGALTPQKRPDFFLTIARELLSKAREHAKSLYVLLVGDGPMRGRLESMIQSSELGKQCRLTGFSPNASAIIQTADLLVSTAVDEALGNVIMEAFMASTPVVASRSGGVCDLIEHGRTGFLANPEQVSEFTAYCWQMIDDPDLARTFCINALEKIKRFDIVSVCKEVVSLYE